MATSLWDSIYLFMERQVVTRLVPKRVGPVMRVVFKIPILFYRAGLGPLMARRILLLTTTGRVTGKLRVTPLEYTYYPDRNRYLLMTGWGGKSDWFRNALACPQVSLQVGNRCLAGVAGRASNEEVFKSLKAALRQYPSAVKAWEGYTGATYDGTDDSLRRLAEGFPSLWVQV